MKTVVNVWGDTSSFRRVKTICEFILSMQQTEWLMRNGRLVPGQTSVTPLTSFKVYLILFTIEFYKCG